MFDLERYAKDLPWNLSVSTQNYGLLIPALAVACKAQTAIEIGIAYGWGSVVLARSLEMVGPTGILFSCDINAHYCDEARKLTADLPVLHTVIPMASTSVDWQSVLEKVNRTHADIIIIDGDHAYETVQRDLVLTVQVLAPGGFVVAHDYGPNEMGVVHAVNQFLDLWNWSMFVLPQDKERKIMGSAVFQRPL